MNNGLIQQVENPQNLYDFPVNRFVATFIGTPQMNIIESTLEKKGEDIFVVFGERLRIKLPADKANDPALKDYIGKEVIIGIRPECLQDEAVALAAHPDSTIEILVEVTELMGAEIYQYLVYNDLTGEEKPLIARVSARSTARPGDKIKIAIDASRIHIFDKDTERCIIH